jgi:hypothetical protein
MPLPLRPDHAIHQGIGIPSREDRSSTDRKQWKRYELTAVDTKDHQPPRSLSPDIFSNRPTFIVIECRQGCTLLFVHGRYYCHAIVTHQIPQYASASLEHRTMVDARAQPGVPVQLGQSSAVQRPPVL